MRAIGEHTVINESGYYFVNPTVEHATAVYSEYCRRILDWGGDFVKIFKIRNKRGNATLAAVFNIDAENRAVSGTLSAAETGQPNDQDCVWYEFFTGSCGIDGFYTAATDPHVTDLRFIPAK